MDRESGALSGLGAVWCQGVQFPEMPIDLGPGSVEVSLLWRELKGKEGRKHLLGREPQGIKMGELRALSGVVGIIL